MTRRAGSSPSYLPPPFKSQLYIMRKGESEPSLYNKGSFVLTNKRRWNIKKDCRPLCVCVCSAVQWAMLRTLDTLIHRHTHTGSTTDI